MCHHNTNQMIYHRGGGGGGEGEPERVCIGAPHDKSFTSIMMTHTLSSINFLK